MNIQKIQKLRNTLASWDNEAKGRKFNMSNFIEIEDEERAEETNYHCGTVVCMAGEVVLSENLQLKEFGVGLKLLSTIYEGQTMFIDDAAAKILGLTYEQSNWLFFGEFYSGDFDENFKTEYAIGALDFLLQCENPDEINWRNFVLIKESEEDNEEYYN